MLNSESPWDHLPPAEEIQARVGNFQARMREMALDAAWILQPADLYYFSRTAQQGLLVIPAEGAPVLFARKSCDRAARESCFETRPQPGYRHWPGLMRDLGCRTGQVGLELDVLPAAEYLRLVKEFPETRFLDATPAIRATRMIKSPYEIACHQEAGLRLAAAFAHLRATVRPGWDERAIAMELQRALLGAGDPGVSRVRNWRAELGTAVVSAGPSAAAAMAFDGPVGYPGSHPALPIGPSRQVWQPGMPLMVDVVASAAGYLTDTTRVFIGGPVADYWRRAHDFTLELMAGLEARLRPGAVPGELYREAVERARQAGYEESFMNRGRSKVSFIGHGIGLELDEWPVLHEKWTEPLRAGMVIAVEPKLIFPDGGVGLENTYAIAPDGPPLKFPLFEENLIQVE